ncbi:hypothetical protein BaRGS_00010716 [Batillaria attramentaria]|uniref:Uncharacterized protein n=1 Tax=Batillaria attramentaria TaxID=370345 RepID=A0ABD0LFC7_9CAEN
MLLPRTHYNIVGLNGSVTGETRLSPDPPPRFVRRFGNPQSIHSFPDGGGRVACRVGRLALWVYSRPTICHWRLLFRVPVVAPGARSAHDCLKDFWRLTVTDKSG